MAKKPKDSTKAAKPKVGAMKPVKGKFGAKDMKINPKMPFLKGSPRGK